jgi:hypothetical protein
MPRARSADSICRAETPLAAAQRGPDLKRAIRNRRKTEHTLRQVGTVLGVTRELVRQIEAAALKKRLRR